MRNRRDQERGLYDKYIVERIDDNAGKHADCEYFVLDLVHDRHAAPALLAYAASCEAEFPQLAGDLRAKAAAVPNAATVPETVAPIAWLYIGKSNGHRMLTDQPPDRVDGLELWDCTPLYSAQRAEALTSGWQPIETAPKDGRAIFLLSAAYDDDYGPDNGGVVHHEPKCAIGSWNPEGDSWVDEHGFLGRESYTLAVTGTWSSGMGWFQPNEVTHWMELPRGPHSP